MLLKNKTSRENLGSMIILTTVPEQELNKKGHVEIIAQRQMFPLIKLFYNVKVVVEEFEFHLA